MTSRDLSDNGIDDMVESNQVQEGHENINQPARLSALERPAVGKRSKKRRLEGAQTTLSKPAKTKGKGTGQGRNLGKLGQILDMPVDIFFEITAQLEPLDVLQLSRVSKHFRSIIASKRSRHIWIAARRNISMPECPLDLTEPQYASLVFEHNCQACGANRTQKVDYSLRVRFCAPCFQANIQLGSKVMKRRRELPELIFTLVPKSSLKTPYNYAEPSKWMAFSSDSITNRQQNAFYIPEIEMVIKRYQELESDPTALKTFVEQRQAIASEMMSSAKILIEWVKTSKNQKVVDNDERMKNRTASIEAKLLALGWEKKDFPSWDQKWDALIRQPRELTPRIWKIIRPKLEAILEEQKLAAAEGIIRGRRYEREEEFRPFWEQFIASRPWNTAQPWAFPYFTDACKLPVINEMLAENESKIRVTEKRWQTRIQSVPDELNEFAIQALRDVVRLLKVTDLKPDGSQSNSPAIDDTDECLYPGILERASSLLSCDVTGCRELLAFPAILQHDHVTPAISFLAQYQRWSVSLSRLRHEPEVCRVALWVLEFLGLSDDTPLAALNEFDGRLVCLCGNPKFQKPMSFQSLVRHLASENQLYETQARTRRTTSYARDVVLNNDHDLNSSEPCIALLSPNESFTPETYENNLSIRYAERYCKDCWILNQRLHSMRENADVTYHMKAKHLKEPGVDDAMFVWQLKRWKKRNPDH